MVFETAEKIKDSVVCVVYTKHSENWTLDGK